jgi:hypothetical protein
MPLAFTVAPCNENDKVYFKSPLERVYALGVARAEKVLESSAAPQARRGLETV